MSSISDLVNNAPEFQPEGGDRRTWIPAWIRDLPDVTQRAWDALLRANDPPRLFSQGGLCVRLERVDRAAPLLRELTPDRTRHVLGRAAVFYMPKDSDPKNPPALDTLVAEEDRKIVLPPTHVVKDILATPEPPLPVISRIVQIPVFAPDGSLQTESGYCAASQTYISLPRGFVIPHVPDTPTADDVAAAKRLLMDDLLSDFPFVDAADRAHALAALLLPFVRDLIEGPTPGHMIEAPQAGSGKGLLAEVIVGVTVGGQVGIITQAKDDDEWRKRITAVLREGPPAVMFDNITHALDSGSLAGALTARVWKDRLLGLNVTVSLPVRCLWIATANNPMFSNEMVRRFVRIRLDPRMDRPWLRDGFRHPQLKLWADAQRPQLVHAALTLAQAWIAAGRPLYRGKVVGSCEEWTAVIGGILESVGVEGFLGNLDEFYESSDIEGAVWRGFVTQWWEAFASKIVGVGDLFSIAQKTDGLDLGNGNDRAQQTRFGTRLRRQRDRVIGDYRVAKVETPQRGARYQLLPMRPESAPPTSAPVEPEQRSLDISVCAACGKTLSAAEDAAGYGHCFGCGVPEELP
jgi:putative DNA primase/helicase